MHQPTADALAAITDEKDRFVAAAAIARDARNRIGAHGDPEGDDSEGDERGLIRERNDAITVLHMLWDVAKSPLADELGLDRRMVGKALDSQAVDTHAFPPDHFYVEAEEVAADEQAAAKELVARQRAAEKRAVKATAKDGEREEAIISLHLHHGWSKVQIVRGYKDLQSKLRGAKIDREEVRDVLMPVLRAVYHLPDWDQEEAADVATKSEAEIKHLRSVSYTAADVAKTIGLRLMNGEVDGVAWANARLVELSGLSSATIAQWRTGSSNNWKRRQRRGEQMTAKAPRKVTKKAPKKKAA